MGEITNEVVNEVSDTVGEAVNEVSTKISGGTVVTGVLASAGVAVIVYGAVKLFKVIKKHVAAKKSDSDDDISDDDFDDSDEEAGFKEV